MGDGGNIPQKARIVCPYFKRFTEERRVIICEGCVKGTESAMVFRTKRDMENYSARMCETYRYGHCPIARVVAEKYMDQE